MALSVEKLLTDAHMLITRLKSDDSLADNIIGSSQALLSKVEAMKQYQDDITELNEIAKHRPRSTLVLGIAQENRQIRQLQQENRELEASLEEHQSALELIMQKYREHTVKLLHTNQIEKAIKEKETAEKNSMCRLMDKIDEMAGVMQKAIEVDETNGYVDKEKLRRMEVENKALREMLEICTTSREPIIIPPSPMIPTADVSLLQNQADAEKDDDGGGGVEEEEEEESEESEADTSTLTRSDHPSKLKKEEGDDDVDSSTLTRQNTSVGTSCETNAEQKKNVANADEKVSGGKEEKKTETKSEEIEKVATKDGKESVSKTEDKKEKPATDTKTKVTDSKKGETLKATGRDSASVRSGSKSPVTSKSTGDLKKPRVSSSPVKKTSSLTSTVKKEATSATVKKSSSTDLKKDLKGKSVKTTGKK